MDPQFITPFIVSIQNVFSTMLQLPVSVGDPSIKKGTSKATFDVSGIIGVTGEVVGTIVLSFPKATAERVVSLFTGQEKVAPEDFADAVGELVNMVSGGAKALFPTKKVSISCPSVVMGAEHLITTQKDTPCILIPCTTDCGELMMEVALQSKVPAAAANPATAAA